MYLYNEALQQKKAFAIASGSGSAYIRPSVASPGFRNRRVVVFLSVHMTTGARSYRGRGGCSSGWMLMRLVNLPEISLSQLLLSLRFGSSVLLCPFRSRTGLAIGLIRYNYQPPKFELRSISSNSRSATFTDQQTSFVWDNPFWWVCLLRLGNAHRLSGCIIHLKYGASTVNIEELRIIICK